MAVWLFFSSAVSLTVGLILFFSVELLRKLSDILDHPVFVLDDKLNSATFLVGSILCLISAWLIETGLVYTELWFLRVIGLLALVFGLIYLFRPGWLGKIRQVGDRLMVSSDEVIYNARKLVGMLLILSSLYIFYGALSIM